MARDGGPPGLVLMPRRQLHTSGRVVKRSGALPIQFNCFNIKREKSMPPSASIIITLALVFYSIGVWSERIAGRLKPWHLAFFYLGLACDTVGTGMMFLLAGGMTFDVHGLTGLLAIILMLLHAVWATIVLVRKDEKWITDFHRFSVVVWVIWLVPYLSPVFFAMKLRA